MTKSAENPDTGQKRSSSSTWLRQTATFTVCIGILSCILLPLAVIVNSDSLTNIFTFEMAEHWQDYQPPQNSIAHGVGANLQVVKLENQYNSIARRMNDISVKITVERATGSPRKMYGTGFVLPGQQVLTNYHVIENAKKIVITSFTDGKNEFSGCVSRIDPANDLALLMPQSGVQLPEAEIGNSAAIDAGDIVFAMGNAYGSGNLFTSGMISDRAQTFSVDGRVYRSMIRTDTYTYPGSSGGPLANIHGQIIGINTVIYSPKGNLSGISFAIPINRVAEFVNSPETGLAGNPYVPGSPGTNSQYSLVV
jgi:S1-C subfamily serine protease